MLTIPPIWVSHRFPFPNLRRSLFSVLRDPLIPAVTRLHDNNCSDHPERLEPIFKLSEFLPLTLRENKSALIQNGDCLPGILLLPIPPYLLASKI
jgi:hypothetical protein